jgi:hypothetical protein
MAVSSTSSTLKVVNRQCENSGRNPKDWASSVVWEAPPKVLEPGGKIRVSGAVTRESYDESIWQGDNLRIYFKDGNSKQ